MEYRSLFDTDTDTLLSEISSLEQQQQQQPQSSTNAASQSQYGMYTNSAYAATTPQQSTQSYQMGGYSAQAGYYSSGPQPNQQIMTGMKTGSGYGGSNGSTGPGSSQIPPSGEILFKM